LKTLNPLPRIEELFAALSRSGGEFFTSNWILQQHIISWKFRKKLINYWLEVIREFIFSKDYLLESNQLVQFFKELWKRSYKV